MMAPPLWVCTASLIFPGVGPAEFPSLRCPPDPDTGGPSDPRSALVSEGKTPTLLEELGSILTEFDVASEAARAARLHHISARADRTTQEVPCGEHCDGSGVRSRPIPGTASQ